jgi:putative solute:sodium symporter small subunit
MRRLFAIISLLLAIGVMMLVGSFAITVIWASIHLLGHPLFWFLMAAGSIVAAMLRALYLRRPRPAEWL